MTDLSPAAQAVYDSAFEPWETADKPELIAAAALRAAADEVCLRWAELKHPADVLNAIADELEKQ
jgi:hypothetical protein